MIYGIPLRLFSKQFHCIFNYCVATENIYTPPQKGLEISWGVGGGGSRRPKILKKCMNLTGIYRGVGGPFKNSFCGGGMDILWNFTLGK